MSKKLILSVSILVILLGAITFVGCLKKNDTGLPGPIEKKGSLNILLNTKEKYSVEIEIGNRIFQYNSEEKGGKTISYLKATENNSVVFESKYELDSALADYRVLQHKKVEIIARSLSFNLGEKDYNLISSQAKMLLEEIFKSSSVRKSHVSSLFFHTAIINTKLRSFRNNGICECVPYPGYILGKSYFWCQEDVIVKTTLIKEVFKNHPELLEDPKAKDLYNYILITKEDYLPYDKIYSFYATKENYLKSLDNILSNERLPCWFGEGSDWGCCGNYSGCCYFWHIFCFIHDAMCFDCGWFCFSGCIPD